MPVWGDPDAGWTDTFPWTRYRGPQAYPVPGGWVLDMPEEGVHWYRYPEHGDGRETDDDVREVLNDEEYNAGRAESAHLWYDIEELNMATRTERINHRFVIDGETVFERIDPEPEPIFAAVAEGLARFDAGESVTTLAEDLDPDTGDLSDAERKRRRVRRAREENASLEGFVDE